MSYNASIPKRAAEDFVRSGRAANGPANSVYSEERPSKKPRFDVRNPSALAPDALEEDATLDADVIGSRGQQIRRGAVNIDGYDSDSDNENFNTRAEARARQKEAAEKKTKDEEDNDMFADLEEDMKDGDNSDGDTGLRGGGKKAVRFLDEDEIEGQVKNSKSGGHVSADFTLNGKGKEKDGGGEDSDSESEVDDVVRASNEEIDEELGAGAKKIHAPKLDAFNMSTENEEGKFDDQGNYVRKATDPDAIHDSWLEGVSKKDMKKAKEAHEKREEARRQRAIEDDAKSVAEILSELIPQLQPGETVLEALARLNRGKPRKTKWQDKRKKQNEVLHDEDAAGTASAENARKKAIDIITEAADILLARGQPEVYDSERELLTRQYRRETGEEWNDQAQDLEVDPNPDSSSMWEYRWSDARDGGEVHGPFDGNTMKQWNDAGYFGEGVEFRRNGNTWDRVADFV